MAKKAKHGDLDLEIEAPEETAESQGAPAADFVVSARKYRPQTFRDLTGQETVAQGLSRAIAENRVPHALLFSGPRGVGKTTTARILAKALNCKNGPTPNPCGVCEHCVGITNGSDLDVIEIDGASNTGVDNIRELRERVNYTSFAAAWKVYIIDEVHMLSQGAFNALLKTLEEPPPRVIFIFATTELDRVPQTIRSRCTPYQFGRIGVKDIAARLAYVVDHEKDIRLEAAERDDILLAIAASAEGGMRDALVTLDQLAALCDGAITLAETRRLLGLVEQGLLIELIQGLLERRTKDLLEKIEQLAAAGQDFERLAKSLCQFMRDLMIVKTTGKNTALLDVTGERLEAMARLTQQASYEQLLQFTRAFLDLEAEMKTAAQPRILMEYTLIKLTVIDPVAPLSLLLTRLEALERSGGASSVSRSSNSPRAPSASSAASVSHVSNAPTPQKAVPVPLADSQPAFRKNDVSDLKGLWESLLAAIAQQRRTLARALQSCEPARIERNALLIRLSGSDGSLFDKSQIEWSVSQKILRQTLKEICGRELEVKVVEAAQPAPSQDTLPVGPTSAAGPIGPISPIGPVGTIRPIPSEANQTTLAESAAAQAALKRGSWQTTQMAETATGASTPAPTPVNVPEFDPSADFDGPSLEDMRLAAGDFAFDAPPVAATLHASASAAVPESALRQMETPKQQLERLRGQDPDFARALDVVITSVNGIVTHINERPLR